ncbi:MAG: leukocidin family pore-forming toxin, partial [Candidatus Thiodiazotropha sp.]
SDWYYVYQIGQFSPSNGFFRNRKRQRLWYVDNYRMDAWPSDFAKDTAVAMIQSSPDTTTGQRTATSSVSYSLSGSVSYSEKGGQAGASGGMTISNSLSVSIPDVSVYNRSIDQVNNAHWAFVIPKVSGKEDGCINDLNPIVPIAHNTFQPKNQWIWRADGRCRERVKSFRITCLFSVEIVNTYIGRCNIFGCNCDVNHQKYTPYPKGAVSEFQVPLPPIKAAD